MHSICSAPTGRPQVRSARCNRRRMRCPTRTGRPAKGQRKTISRTSRRGWMLCSAGWTRLCAKIAKRTTRRASPPHQNSDSVLGGDGDSRPAWKWRGNDNVARTGEPRPHDPHGATRRNRWRGAQRPRDWRYPIRRGRSTTKRCSPWRRTRWYTTFPATVIAKRRRFTSCSRPRIK